MLLTIVLTAVVTITLVVIWLNVRAPVKKLEREVRRCHALTDPQFRREMSVMLGPTILEGNRVDLLQNGDEIFPAMLDAIRGARDTINFETYIYWSGDTGQAFSEALSERARAGVAVSVLADWAGSLKMDTALIDAMRDAGVTFRRFRPLRWYHVGRLNNRTHRKLLIVDGRLGFTGGVGIADQWRGNAEDAAHWRDIHFRIVGPVVGQLQAAFNDNWIKTTGTVLHGARYFPELRPEGTLCAQMFLASPSGGSENMQLMVLTAIAAATVSIDLQAAYFVPDPLTVEALLAARARDVRIRVMVPGKHIDAESVRFASRTHWPRLLDAGVEIFEFRPTMMHNKLLIVDREMVSVGSTNFDQRSFKLNEEASLNVYDAAFALTMTQVFERDLERAERYDMERWRARTWGERLLETLVRPIQSQL
ncbi:MAG: phosphatidylserine/phosphatidylglycerophosphate/cardiolipin synthase family protein [Lautropia sp.]